MFECAFGCLLLRALVVMLVKNESCRVMAILFVDFRFWM